MSFDDFLDNAEFARREKFPFRLLSDRDHRLAVAVGAADRPDQPFARRISYLVGAGGKVLAAYDEVSPADHADEVLRDLPPAEGGSPGKL
ncbi:MAG: thioredoxin-dependent peroxiredoxin [Candidatus Binatota bacterium]|nr:thioredoxin-dependent peroxiredoxin [Candidatus Binatota bacterium]